MVKTGIIAAALVSMLAAAGIAHAQVPPSTCLLQAKDAFLGCKAQCKSDFVDARFLCKNIDPACGAACLAGRVTCFQGVDQILQTGQLPGGGTLANCSGGTNACDAAFAQAKQACGAPCNGNTTCMECVDNAQVQDFECTDTCRDSWLLDPTVKAMRVQCRSTFKSCVTACPPASTTTTTVP
jgi:hypothetical protein